MKNKSTVFKLGELFCGPGGLALGAFGARVTKSKHSYKIVHSWASDYDNDTCMTYGDNLSRLNRDTVLCKDVRDLNIELLPSINCFAYGFPCNDFSVVGEQKGIDGKYGPLYTYGIRVLDHFKPKFFVAENVGGLSASNGGRTFQKILSDLHKAGPGYVLTVHRYKAEEYGVPQRRHRIIIVGIDQNENKIFRVPKPTTLQHPITVREALEDPPIPPDTPNNELLIPSKTVIERLQHTLPGRNAWNSDLPKHLQLNVKSVKLSHIYRRLDPDKPSYTITGSGGGGTHGYHWEEPRALTNRERARIQSFPDNFVFIGSKESVRKQIGMAVPPKLSQVIFTAILKTFAGIRYPSVEPHWTHEPELFT